MKTAKNMRYVGADCNFGYFALCSSFTIQELVSTSYVDNWANENKLRAHQYGNMGMPRRQSNTTYGQVHFDYDSHRVSSYKSQALLKIVAKFIINVRLSDFDIHVYSVLIQ
jgi:hypothetical protein